MLHAVRNTFIQFGAQIMNYVLTIFNTKMLNIILNSKNIHKIIEW